MQQQLIKPDLNCQQSVPAISLNIKIKLNSTLLSAPHCSPHRTLPHLICSILLHQLFRLSFYPLISDWVFYQTLIYFHFCFIWAWFHSSISCIFLIDFVYFVFLVDLINILFCSMQVEKFPKKQIVQLMHN